MTSRKLFPALGTLVLVAACGGSFDAGNTRQGEIDGGSTGGASAGGEPGAGGASSGGAVGAGGMACCLAYPICDPGDRTVAGPDACSPGASCYPRFMCCTTIWCEKSGAASDGGGATDAGAACDTTLDPQRHYTSTDPKGCALLGAPCPAYTTPFSDACGCGCEQDLTCPAFIDCMPGPGVPDPRCSTTGPVPCPYSTRAY